ncbi:MAG TPA: hypothetical protein VJU87_01700 [Gemmatimonadaceae bacterium]|nr:hypothetical protein [Gemmatimonadaceae bacterium]
MPLRDARTVLLLAALATSPLHAQARPREAGGGRTGARAPENASGAVALDTLRYRRAAPELRGLRWRLVGPFRGGRVVAVTGDPTNPRIFYFGAVNGGVWKTTNGGAALDQRHRRQE